MTLDELLESFGMDEDGVSEIAEDSVIDVMIAKSIMAKENLTMDDTTYKNKFFFLQNIVLHLSIIAVRFVLLFTDNILQSVLLRTE